MSDAEVARLVERGDPERWRTAMTVAPPRRAGLMALYAFNLEIARAPWLASEPMLAEIRLRWWRDALDEVYAGASPRRHAVLAPLAAAIATADLPHRLFAELIVAREADVEPVPHADRAALITYIDHTAGHLMELAARHLGAEGAALPVVRDFARGAGAAAYLRALPELAGRGRQPLPADTGVAELAADGLAAIARARARRGRVPAAALAALLPGWLAARVLRKAARDPTAVAAGRLGVSPFRARASLLRRAITGRW